MAKAKKRYLVTYTLSKKIASDDINKLVDTITAGVKAKGWTVNAEKWEAEKRETHCLCVSCKSVYRRKMNGCPVCGDNVYHPTKRLTVKGDIYRKGPHTHTVKG